MAETPSELLISLAVYTELIERSIPTPGGSMTQDVFMLFLTSLVGAFIWGIVNTIKRHFLDPDKSDVPEYPMIVITHIGIATSAFSLGLLIEGLPKVQEGFWLPFSASIAVNIGISYFNVRALKLEDASIVIPLSATMPMFVIVLSWLMLGQFPSFLGRIGIILVALGSYLLNLKGQTIELPSFVQKIVPERYHARASFYFNPWLRLFHSKGAQLALASAYLGAVAINFDSIYVLKSSPMTASMLDYSVLGLLFYGWSKYRGRWTNIPKVLSRKIFVLGLFFGVGCVLMNASFFYGIVPYVGTLRRTQILWTVLLSAVFLKEKHAFSRMLGAIVIFIGCVLIYL